MPKSSARSSLLISAVVLFAVNALNFYDRHVTGALTEPIRKEFHLTDTQVADDGLKALATLPKLMYLHLKKTKVTDEGVKTFRKALPKCEINTGWDAKSEPTTKPAAPTWRQSGKHSHRRSTRAGAASRMVAMMVGLYVWVQVNSGERRGVPEGNPGGISAPQNRR